MFDFEALNQATAEYEAQSQERRLKEEAEKFAAELILNPDNYWIQIVSHAYENKRP